jgi:hypothetical protein
MKERVKAKAMLRPVASVAFGADAELLVLAAARGEMTKLLRRVFSDYLMSGRKSHSRFVLRLNHQKSSNRILRSNHSQTVMWSTLERRQKKKNILDGLL